MKIFIDSNIFLRYLVPENQTSFDYCNKIIALAEEGNIMPYTSNVVVQEVIYVLLKIYKQEKKQILAWVNQLLSLRNVYVIETTNTYQAVEYYRKYNIKFGDCLIATQVPPKAILCTYDPDFAKIPGLKIATPHEVIQQKRN